MLLEGLLDRVALQMCGCLSESFEHAPVFLTHVKEVENNPYVTCFGKVDKLLESRLISRPGTERLGAGGTPERRQIHDCKTEALDLRTLLALAPDLFQLRLLAQLVAVGKTNPRGI